jgi:hypothetical protein
LNLQAIITKTAWFQRSSKFADITETAFLKEIRWGIRNQSRDVEFGRVHVSGFKKKRLEATTKR